MKKRIINISLCFVFFIIISCDKNITNSSPIKPYNPSPSDNQENVSLNTNLTWICGDPEGEQVTYDVYFSTNPELSEDQLVSEGQTSNSYYPGQLDYGRRYNWKVIARDPHNNSSESPV